MRIAQTRLAHAEAAAAECPADPSGKTDDKAAEEFIADLRREAGEVIYEFTCATCGASYVRSLPHLTRDVRKYSSGRVALR
jgi:hypothetical protein